MIILSFFTQNSVKILKKYINWPVDPQQGKSQMGKCIPKNISEFCTQIFETIIKTILATLAKSVT
jgi:hypothetical protein